MARPQNNRAAALELEANALLREQFDAREKMIVQQWSTAETVLARESLHAELKALRNFRTSLYAECKRQYSDTESR